MARTATTIVMVAALAAVSMGMAAAEDQGRFTLEEENDFFSPHNLDRHYTQGGQLNYLSPDLQDGWATAPMDWLSQNLPIFQPGASTTSRHFDFSAGQDLFTPQNKSINPPDPTDRPYAGWVNLGFGLIQDADERVLDHFETQLGWVGPGAAGGATQNRFHLAINDPASQGWDYQLRNEPTLNFYYDRHYRVTLTDSDALLSADVIPEGDLAAGNAYDYLGGGALLRIGQNLKVDYGPDRIEPGLSGTDYFNGDYFTRGKFGWYLFAGAGGRAVGRDIFLDGNTWQSSRSVPAKPLVGELEVGAAVYYSDWVRLSYEYMSQSKEFYGQDGNDDLGAITLSFLLPF